MRVGLARHFLIPHRLSEAVDSEGFTKWIAWYDDVAASALAAASSNGSWDLCYSSDLRRAHETATAIYEGPVERTEILREVPFGPAFRSNAKIPLYIWQTLARIGWYLGHTAQPESRANTRKRVAEFLDMVCARHPEQSVLVVSHGFLMQLLARELRRRGFRGSVPMRPRGGETYVFER